ncbi:sorting nexin-11 isoform X1 [Panthera tigris]|uniref:sorting nexin-11 isoform X1 n=1 Tax=Panthera tigris TaxID=9694 RepID=UPI001C6F9F03|nr:sorting nexin-11 isoform X1 [Panthera tigris]XP_042822675.1 sorting nexin-11 isoform X1 [Panthera tigris]XP_042822676.1 sorting nexin-11 isoform X1 [Panthera tigris]XP_042822677.1 sorting nexin-11 isoform X1 [Panthera tigris]XP_042822678.1 sorting nexin-11 isoform X1 [Panthera tigris]
MGFCCRMLENQEQEEVITVRVQDPRVQNEGSWNSYVDYKIFLHTNSKAFTAKTSCVRRRYREFVWLRKQLQRNAGLVPVPELPGKSTFFGSSDEFIEKRRQGLQHFLEKVLQSVVLLSDSQLHLFLQSQLSVPEIEACVQGRSPMTVSDAILHYAMSNCGWVQEERRGSSHLAKGDQPKSCCFLPRSGRRSSPSPPPREEKDRFEVGCTEAGRNSSSGFLRRIKHCTVVREAVCSVQWGARALSVPGERALGMEVRNNTPSHNEAFCPPAAIIPLRGEPSG